MLASLLENEDQNLTNLLKTTIEELIKCHHNRNNQFLPEREYHEPSKQLRKITVAVPNNNNSAERVFGVADNLVRRNQGMNLERADILARSSVDDTVNAQKTSRID